MSVVHWVAGFCFNELQVNKCCRQFLRTPNSTPHGTLGRKSSPHHHHSVHRVCKTTWWGSLEVCNNRKRNVPWMPEGGAQSKGKDHVYNGQEQEILKTFWALTPSPFFSFISVFSLEGWVPIPSEINNLPLHFFLGRRKINKSTGEGNQLKHWAGVWYLCFREGSCTQPPLCMQFSSQMNLHSRTGTWWCWRHSEEISPRQSLF